MARSATDHANELGIAIVGVAGRFPGASNVAKLWDNVKNGVESVSHYSEEELRAAGVSDELLSQPGYVRAGAIMDGADQFDATFFNYSPMESEYIDPQHRILLECAVEGLEDAA